MRSKCFHQERVGNYKVKSDVLFADGDLVGTVPVIHIDSLGFRGKTILT